MDARICLMRARVAHQRGNHAELRKWMRSIRVFRTAAARWRRRAEKLAPTLVCLLWLAGCVTTPTYWVTDAVSLPHALVSDACEEHYTQDIVTLDHVEILHSGDEPWALDCNLFDFAAADHRRVLVDFRRSTFAVDRIRAYLTSNGVPIPLPEGGT